MAWIESHVEIGEHPKIYVLSTALNVRKAEAVGIVHLLWHFVMKFAWRDGDLRRFDEVSVARACGWEGEPKVVIEALIKAGFLDNGESLQVHDWFDFAGRLVHDRIYNEKRRRKTSVKRRLKPVNRALPNPTLPNPTLPNQPNQKKGDFVPPTLDEVKNYCIEKNYGIDPEAFIAFYQSKNWMIGKNKMRCWKSATTTWEKRNKHEQSQRKRNANEDSRKKFDGIGTKI